MVMHHTMYRPQKKNSKEIFYDFFKRLAYTL